MSSGCCFLGRNQHPRRHCFTITTKTHKEGVLFFSAIKSVGRGDRKENGVMRDYWYFSLKFEHVQGRSFEPLLRGAQIRNYPCYYCKNYYSKNKRSCLQFANILISCIYSRIYSKPQPIIYQAPQQSPVYLVQSQQPRVYQSAVKHVITPNKPDVSVFIQPKRSNGGPMKKANVYIVGDDEGPLRRYEFTFLINSLLINFGSAFGS